MTDLYFGYVTRKAFEGRLFAREQAIVTGQAQPASSGAGGRGRQIIQGHEVMEGHALLAELGVKT